ncbi:MAG: alpha/beta fold hydrolase, partial [Myxococcales bacterium]|nr:alpha/beta fold hydrolase [Myxococcales bacterium]
HGLGDRPENFAQLFRGLQRPTRVILPAGLLPRDDGFSWFKIRARTRDVDGLAKGIAEAADRMAEFIDVVTVDRPTVGKPVITGFSQGGMLSFAVAMRHPDKIAAAFPISGWLPPPLWPEAGPPDVAAPPILALHGDADTVVPLPPTRKAVAKLRELGFPVVLQEYADVRHQITMEMRRLLWKQLGAATLALRAGNPIHLPPQQKRKKRPAADLPAGAGAAAAPPSPAPAP